MQDSSDLKIPAPILNAHPSGRLYRQNIKRLLKILNRIPSHAGSVLMSDKSHKAKIGDGFGDEPVVELVVLVDLVSRRDAGRMEMTDAVEVVFNVADDVSVGDLNVIDIEQDL